MATIFGTNGRAKSTGMPGGDLIMVHIEGGPAGSTPPAGSGRGDFVFGGGGDDLIYGRGGNDTLSGRRGDDTIVGGNGDDYVDGGPDDDVLIGNAGNDTLASGLNRSALGIDRMFGGAGDDLYLVDNPGDVVIERVGFGTDTVISTIDFTLLRSVEVLRLFGQRNDIDGRGNGGDNTLLGSAGDNKLDGRGGVDCIKGRAGDDLLIDSEGGDTLIGGEGNDTYRIFGTTSQTRVRETEAGGLDIILTNVSMVLAPNVEKLILCGSRNINGFGNEAANHIVGNKGLNIIRGHGGDDVLENGGTPSNVRWIIDRLYGGGGDDTLLAIGRGFSVLDGGDGDDLIQANGGDTLRGGDGDDTYVTYYHDVIVETVGEGVDVVFANASFVLRQNIENLTLIGRGLIDGTGNDGANELVGSEKANRINGAGGEDTIMGAAGADTLAGGDGIDLLEGGEGNDRLEGGGGGDTLLGGLRGDSLVGNAGNDVLTGGSGIDRFFFAETAFGDDTITDFEDGLETLDLWGLRAVNGAHINFSHLLISQDTAGARVEFDLDGDGLADPNMRIDLLGMAAADLSADDFAF